jgi:SAM-dependent methyltransferase
MRFYGFSPRAALVRKFLGAGPKDVVLEIGPGSGNTAREIIGRVAGYWGADISAEAIRGLREAFGDREDVILRVADACSNVFLGRTFDRVFAMDTLEHIRDTRAFFRFAARHLVPGGTALVVFPNEKEKDGKVHGIARFDAREDLEETVRSAGLEIEDLLEIQDTAWHKIVRAVMWKAPRAVVLRAVRWLQAARGTRSGEAGRQRRGATRRKARCKSGRRALRDPDTYGWTDSCRLNERGGVVRDAAAAWARIAECAARLFPLFRSRPAGAEITGRRILLRLRKSSCI